MKEKVNLQLYDILFRTWFAQIDSYWQRSSYFGAFETFAIGGAWWILRSGDRRTGLLLGGLGVLLTLCWYLNNLKTYDYVLYWMKALQEVERAAPANYISNYDQKRRDFGLWKRYSGLLPYHTLIGHVIPFVFLAGWVVVLCLTKAAPTCPPSP